MNNVEQLSVGIEYSGHENCLIPQKRGSFLSIIIYLQRLGQAFKCGHYRGRHKTTRVPTVNCLRLQTLVPIFLSAG